MTNLHMNLTFHPGTQPPKTGGAYLTISGEANTMQQLNYSARHGLFNCWDSEDKPQHAYPVRWWAVLPAWMPWAGPAPRGEG